MARQTGNIRVTGSCINVTFSRREDGFTASGKTGPSSKQFWNDPEFEGSRAGMTRLRDGQYTASKIYRKLPEEKKVHELFVWLRSLAIHYIKIGTEQEEMVHLLKCFANRFTVMQQPKPRKRRVKKAIPYSSFITAEYVVFKGPALMRMLLRYTHDEIKAMVNAYFSKDPVVALSPPGEILLRA